MELTPNLHAFLWRSPTVNNCNTYLIRSGEKEILIDPGHAVHFDHVRTGLRSLGLGLTDIDLIICTHAHPDHIEAVRLFERPPTLFALHEAEWRLAEEIAPHLRAAMGIDPALYTPDLFLTAGDLHVGDITLTVHHTPGHAPGALTLFWPEAGALFTGDLIFKDAFGRTDLPGGDDKLLKESLGQIAGLEADWLLPGHGELISGREAVRANFEEVQKICLEFL